MENKIDKKFVIDRFSSGTDCSQIVLSNFSEKLGISDEMAKKISSPFGAGMFNSEKCGSVTGAYLVLGLYYGHSKEGEFDKKNKLVSKMKEFDNKFKDFSSSDSCKDILGYDLTKDEEAKIAIEKGILMDVCPNTVLKSIQILEEIMND